MKVRGSSDRPWINPHSPPLPSKRRGDPRGAESLENLLTSRLVIETIRRSSTRLKIEAKKLLKKACMCFSVIVNYITI